MKTILKFTTRCFAIYGALEFAKAFAFGAMHAEELAGTTPQEKLNAYHAAQIK